MSRDLTVAYQTALADPLLRPAVFYEGVFASGTLRLWSGLGSITWNGQTWLGAGDLLTMTGVQETTDVRASGLTCSLSGQPSALISSVLSDAQQGLAGTVWLALLNAAGAVIADPALSFKGRLDVPAIEEAGEKCTITISYESRLIDLERARNRRYTQEDQAIDYPADKGFDFVPSIQDVAINWGVPSANNLQAVVNVHVG